MQTFFISRASNKMFCSLDSPSLWTNSDRRGQRQLFVMLMIIKLDKRDCNTSDHLSVVHVRQKYSLRVRAFAFLSSSFIIFQEFQLVYDTSKDDYSIDLIGRSRGYDENYLDVARLQQFKLSAKTR